jgi:hypothetical protein
VLGVVGFESFRHNKPEMTAALRGCIRPCVRRGSRMRGSKASCDTIIKQIKSSSKKGNIDE